MTDWTEEMVETAIDAWNRGLTNAEIGRLRAIRKSRCAVAGKLQRMAAAGDERIKRPMRLSGTTRSMSRRRSTRGGWSDQELLYLLQRRDAGDTFTSIAADLGRTEHGCKSAFLRLEAEYQRSETI